VLTLFLCLVGLLVLWVMFASVMEGITGALSERNRRIDARRWAADRDWKALVDIYKERGLPVPPRPKGR
jgi:F0F1-type ATP synthase membrane subunit b/b'